MNESTDSSLIKEEEERKRRIVLERDPEFRWKLMMDAIAFAEANMKPEFRRNRPRWRDAQGKVHYY